VLCLWGFAEFVRLDIVAKRVKCVFRCKKRNFTMGNWRRRKRVGVSCWWGLHKWGCFAILGCICDLKAVVIAPRLTCCDGDYRSFKTRPRVFFLAGWDVSPLYSADQHHPRGVIMSASASSDDRSWYIAERWQQYEGEARANLLRIASIGAFYLIHLWNYFSSQGKLPDWGFLQLAKAGEIDRRFHVMVTLLALAWIALAAAVHLSLRARVFPGWLPTASTVVDVLFLSGVLCISSGPRSPLVVGYFLIIALAALRFSLPLVRIATVGVMVGYVGVLGCAKWPATFGLATEVEMTVPRFHQLVVLVGLGLTGIVVGQVIRRVRRLAGDYARRLSEGTS